MHYFNNLIKNTFYTQINIKKIQFLSKFKLKKTFSITFTLKIIPYIIKNSHI